MRMATNFDWGKTYSGARWVRVDLHLHSPGAYSFRFPNGLDHRQLDEVVKRYVDQLKAQGIEIAAITDYQRICAQWFVPIREAALQEGIYVYPGVELSFGGGVGGKDGLHILAIFPFDADVKQLNRTIDKLLDDRPGESLLKDDGQHRDLEPKETLSKCLQRLREETGCLLIFPHPNDSKGLFKSFKPKEAAELLAAVRPEAVEELGDKDRERLQSTGEISPADLARIASVRFSDNHSIEEIGTKRGPDGTPRATYLKLSVLNDLRAVRLALRDHEILVRLGEKPEPTHTRIEGIEVDGSGFLGDMRLALSPELNVLIGGRGVGKSALLEVLRYGLDLPEYSPTEYREGLVQHALGSGGKVTVHLRHVVKPGVERRYRVERVWGEEAQVYELDASGGRRVELLVADLLSDEGKPLFFGQRVLYEVAQSPKLRRQFLDDLVGLEARHKEREIERLQQELRRNARRLWELREKQARREEVERRLREIEHELRLFEQHGLAEKLREETALARDEERLKRAEAIPLEFGQEWEEMRARWQERLRSALADLSQAESRTRTLLQQDAAKVIRDLQAGLEGIFQQGAALLQKAEEELRGVRHRWEEGRRALDEELRKIRQELGRETLDPDRLVQLTREKEKLEYELKMLRQAEAEAQNLERERRDLLQKLRDVRREAFRLREKRAQAIKAQVGQRVKVEVLHRGQRQEYAQRLLEFFSGSRVPRKDLEGIATHEDIADGWALAELARKGKQALMEKTGLSEAQAQRLVDFLVQDEARLYGLELLSPEDEVQVSLKVDHRWVPLEKLSAGQRATAMLLILLTQTQHLLIIDQPEDDLDNRFVYEDVVKLLRSQKGRRQIIVATHNPNIPVLGHGELVTALEAESERTRISVQGGMDKREVQDEVRRVMEGGDEAFRRRAEKYGWA
jgi:energy-coupling factor transporter ATP-binding protein EcfA2